MEGAIPSTWQPRPWHADTPFTLNRVRHDAEHKYDCQRWLSPCLRPGQEPGARPHSHRRRHWALSAELAPGPRSRPSGRDARCSSRRPPLDGAPRRRRSTGTGRGSGRAATVPEARRAAPPRQTRSTSPFSPLPAATGPAAAGVKEEEEYAAMAAECPAPRQGGTGTDRAAAREASANTAAAAAGGRCVGRGAGERCPPPAPCWSPLPPFVPPLRSAPLPACPAPPRGRSADSARRPAALARVLWRSLPPQKLGPAAAAARWGAPMVPAPAAVGHVHCRPPRCRNLGEVSERVGEYRAAAPRRCSPPAWRSRVAASPPPGATGRGPAAAWLRLPSLGRGGVSASLPHGPGRCRSRSGSGAARVPLLWAVRRRSRGGPRRQLWPRLGRRAGGENSCHVPCCGWWMGCRGREA